MNQRLSSRTPVHIKVEVHFPGHEPMTVKTRDMSLNGMFLETGAPVPPHSMIGVRVPADNRYPADDSIQLVAVVTRRDRQGLGVNYPLCSDTARKRMRGLIEAVCQQAGLSQPQTGDGSGWWQGGADQPILPEEG
jgi:hypothetical protein